MAEIFLVTRGHADHVEKFVRNMRSQYFPMQFKKKVKDEEGNEFEIDSTNMVEGQMRPYQLWGFVCPEQFVAPMCANLGIPTNETFFDKAPKPNDPKNNSFGSGFGVQGFLSALRLSLNAQKLPSLKDAKVKWANPIYRNNISVLGVGWKPDGTIKTKLGEHEGI